MGYDAFERARSRLDGYRSREPRQATDPARHRTVQVDAPGGSPVYVPATAIPGTGGWDTFQTWAPASTFTLNAGAQVIDLYFPVGGCDIDYFEIYQ